MNAWWAAALAGAVCGLLSGLGIGGGTLLMVWMTGVAALPQQTAQGINLLYFLPSAACGMEVVLWDERRTTVEAHQILSDCNYHGKKRKNTVDAVAASLILEGYLAFLSRC